MANLKPCPFCGNPEPVFMYDIELVPHAIHCLKCGAFIRFFGINGHKDKTFGETMEKIAQRWNRRDT